MREAERRLTRSRKSRHVDARDAADRYGSAPVLIELSLSDISRT
jgi:hypothetical protein